ncbi:MAG: hypothetical protein ABIT36_06945, partial [Steroidobacteraceae bacterium]
MDTDHSTPVRPPATLARLGRLQRRWLLILWAALLGFWGSQLTEAPITKDAAENLAMAFSLKDQGVISSSPEPPYEKSMSREPLPAVINAANLYIIEALAGRVTYAESLTGARARTLKLQNLFWLSLLSAAIFTATFRFSGGSFVWSVATVITTSALLLLPEVGTYMLNSLCTEAPAAALLSLGSLFAAESIRRPRWPNLLGAGITFGLLSLVKASFFYVSLGLVVFTPLLLLL